jgi:NAD/NADP transhydrogenase alpha subunit
MIDDLERMMSNLELDRIDACVPTGVPFACGDHLHHLTIFVLACLVGYYIVWKVTPALHAPLMSVTNAISSVIIVGAILAASQNVFFCSKSCGFVAIVLASINIFGGFTITNRMLSMFQKNKRNGNNDCGNCDDGGDYKNTDNQLK